MFKRTQTIELSVTEKKAIRKQVNVIPDCTIRNGQNGGVKENYMLQAVLINSIVHLN